MKMANESARFIYVICQAGAQTAAKTEIMALPQNLKLAYSQPGFVTFKVDAEKNLPERFTLPVTLARTYGWSLGKVAGENTASLISELLGSESFKAKLPEAKHVHVYQREKMLPGGQRLGAGCDSVGRIGRPAVGRKLERILS